MAVGSGEYITAYVIDYDLRLENVVDLVLDIYIHCHFVAAFLFSSSAKVSFAFLSCRQNMPVISLGSGLVFVILLITFCHLFFNIDGFKCCCFLGWCCLSVECCWELCVWVVDIGCRPSRNSCHIPCNWGRPSSLHACVWRECLEWRSFNCAYDVRILLSKYKFCSV